MAGALITCPNCKSTLTFGQDLPANAVLRCPMCQTTFAVRPAAIQAAATPPAPAPAPAKAAPTPPIPAPQPALPKAVAAPARRPTAPSSVRMTAPANGHANGKSAPRPAPAAAESRAGRYIGGAILGLVALLCLGGLALLAWTQLPRDHGTPNKDGNTGEQVALAKKPGGITAPVVQDSSGKTTEPQPKPPAPVSNPAPPVAPKKDNSAAKDPEDDDLANQKKQKATPVPAPPVEPKKSPEPPVEPKPKPPAPPEPAPKPPEPQPKDPPVVVVADPTPPDAPGVTKQRVDDAIARGVNYLKSCQKQDGSWHTGRTGYAALCGLALLECQVPANDATVQRAAQFVRTSLMGRNAGNAIDTTQTYDLSASILFLDKLGDKQDREFIRNLALRILTSQNPVGGWGYTAQPVYRVDPQDVQSYLRTHFPFDPKHPRRATDAGTGKTGRDAPGQAAAGKNDGKGAGRRAIDLQKLPPRELLWNKWNPFMGNPADNSNTQFALLALWAARRHDVPVECAALLSYERYLQTQNADGGWPYVGPTTLKGFPTPAAAPPGVFAPGGNPGQGFPMPPAGAPPLGAPPIGAPQPGLPLPGGQPGLPAPGGMPGATQTTPTMTCVGLLGLAMGSGSVPAGARANPGDLLKDPAVVRGLRRLAEDVGTPDSDAKASPRMKDLYLLWSIERVAMLYDLKTIGGKDWYGWGAQILLANQVGDGSWTNGGYNGACRSSDTSFALLFLKRSNLMPELTENLQMHRIIRDPGAQK